MKRLIAVIALGAVAMAASAVQAKPSLSLRNACLSHVRTYAPGRHVDVAVEFHNYGLCEDSDQYTGGELVFRRVSERSSWLPIGGSGGAYGASDADFVQAKYHVPAPIFRELVREANAALRLR